MLSGRPDSATARRHAEELLAPAERRPRSGDRVPAPVTGAILPASGTRGAVR